MSEKHIQKEANLVRGMRDLLPRDMRRHRFIIDIVFKWGQRFGFDSIDTPIVEMTSLFERSLGDASDMVSKEMYTFLDRGDTSLTLRPEATAGICRLLKDSGLLQKLPQKLMCYGPMFRYERPQKGRYRQFFQLSAEFFGSHSATSDIECLSFAHHVLNELPIPPVTLHLNTLGDTKSRCDYITYLTDFLEKYKNALSLESQHRLVKNPLRILDSKNQEDQRLVREARSLKDFLSYESLAFFERVEAGLHDLSIPYIIDPYLVRGIDYYSHTVFEFKAANDALGSQDTVLAGGRYDGLVHEGKTPIPSVGFAFGIDRLSLLLPESIGEVQDLLIALLPHSEADVPYCLKLANRLRLHGFTIHLIDTPLSLGKRLKICDRLSFDYALILGEDERTTNKLRLKQLKGEHQSEDKECLFNEEEVFLYLSLKKKDRINSFNYFINT